MRRAERLFRIVSLLRSGRLLTGAQLAERLDISLRTLYRDIAGLQTNGTPIQGEAGVGYTLRSDLNLPTLHFDEPELTALLLGARMVRAWGGEQMGRNAAAALAKIESVLPEERRGAVDRVLLFAPEFPHPQKRKRLLDRLHAACDSRRLLHISYRREDGTQTERTVQPLGLYFWGGSWTLVAWCDLRVAFRVFRLDRMQVVAVLDQTFQAQRGRTLSDFLRLMREAERTRQAPPVLEEPWPAKHAGPLPPQQLS